MRGAVPCLPSDLTTHAVRHFIQALQMGRRDAVRGSGNGRGREAQMGRRDAVRGSDNGRATSKVIGTYCQFRNYAQSSRFAFHCQLAFFGN